MAVATNRAPAAISECLTALARERAGAGALLVVSGGDESFARAHEHAAPLELPGVEVLHEPAPGASRARNRALAACGEGDVIAYVDDDGVVCPGWLGRLRAAWEAAGPEVACIGGPIRPRFEGGEPAWISAPLLSMVTRLDYGPDPIDVDPDVRGIHGPNMSFRCALLRAIGGFDPAYGPRPGRPWFGEEDEAERALARRGYRIRYVPDAPVAHVIARASATRRALLRRRFYYGGTLASGARRPPSVALRGALGGLVAAAGAAARGDERLAMEQAARAAENAGALAFRLAAPLDRGRSIDPRDV